MKGLSVNLTHCAECGADHPDDGTELFFRRPDAIMAIPAAEREQGGSEESDDVCAIWGDTESEHRYFVRGLMPFQVLGTDRTYNIGIWAEITREAFDTVFDKWEDDKQAEIPAFPGTLANTMPFQQDSLGIGVSIQLVSPKTRPTLYVTDKTHMLHAEQMHGISAHMAHLYTELSKRKGRP